MRTGRSPTPASLDAYSTPFVPGDARRMPWFASPSTHRCTIVVRFIESQPLALGVIVKSALRFPGEPGFKKLIHFTSDSFHGSVTWDTYSLLPLSMTSRLSVALIIVEPRGTWPESGPRNEGNLRRDLHTSRVFSQSPSTKKEGSPPKFVEAQLPFRM